MMPSGTALATGIANTKVKYSKFSRAESGYIELQLEKRLPKIPYKAIALVIVLFAIGSFLIIIGFLLLEGSISKGRQTRGVPLLVIGILFFLPGVYHLRMAYCESRDFPGSPKMKLQTLVISTHLSPEKSHRWD